MTMFALTFYVGKWCGIKQVMDYMMIKYEETRQPKIISGHKIAGHRKPAPSPGR
jgi:hypothetical protein